jgi:two-component system, chemotaxis family, sensor kinase CheA
MSNHKSLKNKTLLLVDDNDSNLFVLEAMLGEEEGVTLIKAFNGKEALEHIYSDPSIDLVLLDMMMPVLNGYETCLALRAHEQLRYRELPIISITASAMINDRERCIDAGANDYISKPFQVDELMKKIIDLL